MTNKNNSNLFINYKNKIQAFLDSLNKKQLSNFDVYLEEINSLFTSLSSKKNYLEKNQLQEIVNLISVLKEKIQQCYNNVDVEISSLKKTEKVLANYYKTIDFPSKIIDQKR
jgi:hypothetical protein